MSEERESREEEELGAAGGDAGMEGGDAERQPEPREPWLTSTAFSKPDGVTRRRGRPPSLAEEESGELELPSPQRLVFMEERMGAMEVTLMAMSRTLEQLALAATRPEGKESAWSLPSAISPTYATLPVLPGRPETAELGARPKRGEAERGRLGPVSEEPESEESQSEEEGGGRRGVARRPRPSAEPARGSGRGRGQPAERAEDRGGAQARQVRLPSLGWPPAAPGFRREELRIEFDGESGSLAFFLTMVRNYMTDFGQMFPSEASRVRMVGGTLRKAAAEWFVQCHDRRDPCLGSLHAFLRALERRFKDPLEGIKAKERLRALTQGARSVTAYVEEFQSLAGKIPEWSDTTKLEIFKGGLRRDVLEWAFHRDDPETLAGWIELAGKVETIQLQMRRQRREPTQDRKTPREATKDRSSPGPGKSSSPSQGKWRKGGCFVCGKEGHRAANCWQRKGGEATRRLGAAVPAKRAEEKTPSEGAEGEVVSLNGGMMVIPMQLESGGMRATARAFVDCGCSRNIITPELAQGLQCKLVPLETPVAFTQLDGSTASGELAGFGTEKLVCKIGKWVGSISFVVTPIARYSVILGMPWLRDTNPRVDWRSRRITFPEEEATRSQLPGRGGQPQGVGEMAKMGREEGEVPEEYRDFLDVFSKEEAEQLPPKRRVECGIELIKGAELPKPRLYPMSLAEREVLREFIDTNLRRGFIEPSKSPLAAPVLFRKKQDGSLRLCTDFRGLNAISTVNRYPMPLIKDLLAHLGGGKIFTKLDIRDAYFRVRVKKEDRWKTAFSCALGHFQYNVMPFGLSRGGSVFMQLINETLHPLLYKGVLVYLDDILIVSREYKQHVELVREVLARLRGAKLFAKLSKCEFHQKQLDFLGFRISGEGIAMDPAKVKDVLDWATPRTRKQLQSFLGFANFYRNFIKDFAVLTLPLTELLKTKGRGETRKVKSPGAKLEWSPECQRAFETLKTRFTSEPILRHPDMAKPFVVHCDASDWAYGAVLLQRGEGGVLMPCAFLSRKFSETERNWPIWEKEAYAVKGALETWRHYLEGASQAFEVWSDHKNLQYLRTPQKLSAKQVRWAQFFSRFNFTLHFFKGKHNILADSLSRLPQHIGTEIPTVGSLFTKEQWGMAVQTRSQTQREGRFTVLASEGGAWERELKQAYATDEWLEGNKERCEFQGGICFVNKKVYVPLSLRGEMLRRCHDNKSAGHLGFTKTIKLLAKQCWWPGLRKDTKDYVQKCERCAENKTPKAKPQGLLQTVTEPQRPWSHVAMDFVVELPPSRGHTVIWTVMDLFSKQTHFVPLKGLPSAEKLAELYILHIYRLHGCPDRVISDRGVQFTARFWRGFVKLLGAEQGLSSAYHPMTNGAVERTQQTLEHFLRTYANYEQNNWVGLLPFAEVAFNGAEHSATGVSPFKTVYGQEVAVLPRLPEWEGEALGPGSWIEQITSAWPRIRGALQEAQKKYKRYADMKRREGEVIREGDLVWLATKHLKLGFPSKKLGPKYVGPFRVSKQINQVTYELTLPKDMGKIHPVFHCSLLKKYKGTLDDAGLINGTFPLLQGEEGTLSGTDVWDQEDGAQTPGL